MTHFVTLLLLVASGQPAEKSQAAEFRFPEAAATLIAEVRVPAQDSGVIRELLVDEGDYVQSGQRLGELNSKLTASDLRRAEIELEIAKARAANDVDRRTAETTYEVALDAWQRSMRSAESVPGSITKTELERQRLEAEKAKLDIEQAERDQQIFRQTEKARAEDVARIREQLELRRFTAPFRGMVVELFRQPSEWVAPGDVVLRVIRLDKLRIEAFIDGRVYGNELKGRPAAFVTASANGKERVYRGIVTFVSPELHPVSGRIRIAADVENTDLSLRPGERGTLTVSSTPDYDEEPTAEPDGRGGVSISGAFGGPQKDVFQNN